MAPADRRRQAIRAITHFTFGQVLGYMDLVGVRKCLTLGTHDAIFKARTIPFGDINPSITGDGARELTFSWHAAHIVLNTSAPRSSI